MLYLVEESEPLAVAPWSPDCHCWGQWSPVLLAVTVGGSGPLVSWLSLLWVVAPWSPGCHCYEQWPSGPLAHCSSVFLRIYVYNDGIPRHLYEVEASTVSPGIQKESGGPAA